MLHLVSRINYVLLSVNLIAAYQFLTYLLLRLSHPLPLRIQRPRHL